MNILLINGGKAFAHSQGKLNQTLHEQAHHVLVAMGHDIQTTTIDNGYDIDTEIAKFQWMEVVVWQMPGWWMGAPWTVKKYVDEVLTAGHGKLYDSDGRHRTAPTEGYGSGGRLQGKKHLLSLTWNAPIEAFERKGDFFDGLGVDAVYLPFHKIHAFMGMSALPTFICNDVVKNPHIAQFVSRYTAHLQKVLG